jgi:hypothetical protein
VGSKKNQNIYVGSDSHNNPTPLQPTLCGSTLSVSLFSYILCVTFLGGEWGIQLMDDLIFVDTLIGFNT